MQRRRFLQAVVTALGGLRSLVARGRPGLLAGAAAASGSARLQAMANQTADVVVVGAGVFGAWTAFQLRQQGARPLLVDAWEPGHLRATSSGESRVTRCAYGAEALYTRWSWEALTLWKQWQQAWGVELFHRAGVLWMHREDDAFLRASRQALTAARIPFEPLSADELGRRWPPISTAGIGAALYEPEAGALEARTAMRTLFATYRQRGGEWRLGRAEAPAPPTAGPAGARGRLDSIRLADGSELAAAQFVFACGPWLPELFPDALRNYIRVTRQEVFFFGTPPGDARFSAGALPVWAAESFYGIPALAGRGFKIADNNLGPPFDPTSGERTPSADGAARARDYVAQRFPALKYAPLVEARVCQYESTTDSHLLIDRHPAWSNVWLVGGGSGHGFKLGPRVGQVVAEQVLGRPSEPLPEEVRLRTRLARAAPALMA